MPHWKSCGSFPRSDRRICESQVECELFLGRGHPDLSGRLTVRRAQAVKADALAPPKASSWTVASTVEHLGQRAERKHSTIVAFRSPAAVMPKLSDPRGPTHAHKTLQSCGFLLRYATSRRALIYCAIAEKFGRYDAYMSANLNELTRGRCRVIGVRRSRLAASKVTPDAMMHVPKGQPERTRESRYGLRGMRSTRDVEAFSSRSQKIVNRPRIEIRSLSDHLPAV